MNGISFTERLNILLGNAAGEAQALNHEYIGTEHLLLALLAEPESIGARMTRSIRRRLSPDLETHCKTGKCDVLSGHFTFSRAGI